MPTLYLLRHAKSSWDDPMLADADRPLNARGLRDAPRMAVELARRNVTADWLWLSPSVRTRQTAERILPLLKAPLRTQRQAWMYHASGPLLLHRLTQVPDEVRSLLIIGHEPGLGELASHLLEAPFALPTCACLALELPSWQAPAPAREIFFVFPKGLSD